MKVAPPAPMIGSDFIWKPWGDLWQTIVTGQPAFARVLGATPFEYLAAHPDEAAIAAAAMTSVSSVQLSDILAAYDFSRFERIVDLGGGQGLLLHDGVGVVNCRSRRQSSEPTWPWGPEMSHRSLLVGALMLGGCSPILLTPTAEMRVQCQSGDQSACVSYVAAVNECLRILSPWASSWTKENCYG